MVFPKASPTIPGQQYELSFYLGTYTQRWGGPPVSITASAGNASETFTVATTSTASTWTQFSMQFMATAANTPVTLIGSAGFQYIGLDNLSVENIGGTPIPEPRTYVLMTTALALLIGAGHRKRRV